MEILKGLMTGFAEPSDGKLRCPGGSVNRRSIRLGMMGRVGQRLRRAAMVVFLLGTPLASIPAQEEERDLVVRGLSFTGNDAIDDYTLQVSIATSNSSFFARNAVSRKRLCRGAR
jgi:hypothetical protein